MHSRLGFFLECSKRVKRPSSSSLFSVLSSSPLPFRNSEVIGRVLDAAEVRECNSFLVFNSSPVAPTRRHHFRSYCSYAAEQFSDDEYECDYDNQPVIVFLQLFAFYLLRIQAPCFFFFFFKFGFRIFLE